MSSIVDDPNAFFDSLIKETPEEKKPEAPAPVAAAVDATEKPEKAPAIEEDPNAFFDSISPAPEVPGKQEKAPDSVDLFAQSTEHLDPEMFDPDHQIILSTWTPDEWYKFKQIRPDYPIPDDKQREIFDAERAGTLKKPESPGFWEGIVKPFAAGVGKFSTSVFGTPEPGASEEEIKNYAENADKAIRSYVASAVKLPVEYGPNFVTKLATGGSSWSDWLSEKYFGSTPDDSFRRYQARQTVDTANGYLNRRYGNVYGRVVAHPAVQQGLASFIKLNIPGISDEEAAAAADQAAKEVGQTHDIDQDIETAGSFLLPEGLGMGEFGYAFMGLKAARGAKGLIRGATMTQKAQQQLAQKELGESVDKASKPGAFGIAAGKLADTTEKLQQAATDFAEKYPTLTGLGKYSAQYVPGAILGYHSDPEHPFRNAFLGAAIERTSLGALTRLKLGEAAVAVPRTIQELGAARAISAGGRKGMFELAGAAPEASKLTQKLFEKSGRRWDKFGNFLKDVGREGVDVAAVTGALGVLRSEDIEQMKENLQTGAGFVGLGRIMHAAMGEDPAAAARRIRQQDVDNYKTLQQLSPETQTHLRDIMDWDSVIAQRQTQLDAAVLGGDQGEIAAAAERLAQAQKANVATREAYARGVGNVITGMHEILNGPFRVGQKTAAIEALTTDQIVDRLAANNPNVPRSELEAVARRGAGLYFPTGAREFVPGEDLPTALRPVGAKYTFDPLRATAVVNMDNVLERAHVTGRPFADALRHEWGHVLDAVPEFRELNAETDRMLFDTENRGLDGKVYSSTKGLFSDKDLVKMFTDEYLSHLSPEEIKNWASSQLLWDELGQKLNEKAVAEYMKAEVRADLNSMSFTGDNLNKLESWQQHVMDWARLNQQNTLVGKAINGIFGAGGRDPYATTETIATQAGRKFTPELLAAHRNAIRQLQKLNGMVSPTTTGEYTMPVLTKTQLIGNKALRERYGKDSGLFKTEFRATVFDKDGNVVGTTVVTDPAATEGSWGMENGTLTQRSGFGNVPAGTTVPEGGSVKVSREIVMGPDGETPQVLSAKEIKQLVKTRASLIRDALDNAYQGEPDGFRSVSEDGLTYRGTFTPAQIAAIQALPESVVPAKTKETILRFNKLIAEGKGQRILLDYAARMDDRGNYKPFSPKIYDVVPIGMHFSKDGNFLITTISVTRLLDKLNLWAERLPNRLSPWGGNREAFFHQFVTDYLPNHLAGRPGETGLDADPKVALQKKNIFNDFLNLTNNDARMANPDRTVVPRKKGDPKGKDANRTIMSIRADAVADMLESTNTPIPVDYGKQLMNYLPARETKAKQEEPIPFRVDEQNPILKALNVVTPRAANDDVRRISEEYVKGAGMPYRPHGQAIPVNEDLAKRIADHYEAEKDNPNDPAVRKAYTALANETVNQWKAFEKAGYTATPWTGEGQPYANSAEMMKDVRDNKHLYYFTTEGGFGETGISDQMREENPMLAPSGVNFNGAENVPVNDVFRVVHDIVGHGANGYEFGPKGEFNAYLEHSRMFSDAAKPALAAETLAQNSWVNYGPHLRDEAGNLPKKGQPGYIAPQDRPFAQQKNIALPQEFIEAAEEHAKNTIDTQTQKSLTGGINQSPSDATQQTPRYLPERGTPSEAIPGAEGAREEDSQARASERVRLHSGLAAVARAASSAGEEGVPGSAQSPAARKDPKGEDALREYADEHDLWGDPDAFFEQWRSDGSEAGGEHQVSFPEGPDVIKRTYNPNYPDWPSYFDALNVHNALFPKAALTFRRFHDVEGFGGVDIEGKKWPAGLYAEVSQPKLEIVRGLTVPETDALMETRGFYQVRPFQYYNPELKMFMTDLHPGNAVMLKDGKGNEMPYVIDSYIRPEGEKDARDVQRVNDMLAGEEQIPDLRMRYLPAKKLTVQHPSEEKEGSVGGDLDLVHFGAYGVSTADPKKMGKGSATGIDRSGLPKTYFYVNGTKYEEGIKEQTPYLAKVDGNSIYDLDADPLGLKQANREEMDKAIKAAGFAGYFSKAKREGQTFSAVAMFKKTKLTEALPTDVFSKKEAAARAAAGGPEIDYAAQDEAFYGPSYLPSKVDEAHAKAVESGDMEEAQRLVDEKAKQAGLISAYHGTPSKALGITSHVFKSAYGKNQPIWFTPDKEGTKTYGNRFLSTYLKLGKNKIVDFSEHADDREASPEATQAKDEGYDSLTIQNAFDGERAYDQIAVFSPEQIKSADPATYDDQGKLIPLSQRFNPESNDIRYLPAKLDEAHAKAIESGDTEEAQRLVDEAAKKAGYTIGPVFHGSQSETPFNTFISNHDDGRIFFTTSKPVAKQYARKEKGYNKVYSTFLRGGDVETIDMNGASWWNNDVANEMFETVTDYFNSKNAPDTIVFENVNDTASQRNKTVSDVYVVRNPNNIKSADPATYDDQGNLIPLSQRFNPESNDIRYLPAGKPATFATQRDEAKELTKGAGKGAANVPLLVFKNEKGEDKVGETPGKSEIVVRPLPNIQLTNPNKVTQNLIALAETSPQKISDFVSRVDEASRKLSEDPERFVNPKGYTEYMREVGASSDIMTPPSGLEMIVKRPDEYLALLKGGFHGEKTIPGTKEAAIAGLDGVAEMRNIIGPDGPTPFVTALHHLWGTLSKQLPPLDQEAMFLRMASNPKVLAAINDSIQGNFKMSPDEWKAIVQEVRHAPKGDYGKFGNNATANANTYYLMLNRHNGKWQDVANIYKNDDAVAMRSGFWSLGHGATGIKNKVVGFIGLTFGVKGSVLDRWRFVDLHLPMAMKLQGAATPEEYFSYTGRDKNIPEDPTGIYKLYGTVENGNPAFSTAFYAGVDRASQAAINNSPALKAYLGEHADPGGLHWVAWNAIKNEAVGHSSLDITKSFLQKYGRSGGAEEFLKHVGDTTAFVQGPNKGKVINLIMDKGNFRIEDAK